MNYTDKVVLITGAGSGIGEDVAIGFAKKGAKVVVVDLCENGLNSVENKILNAGSAKPFKILADVTKDAQKIIDQTIEHFGKLDVLVNNAGIFKLDTASSVDFDIFDKLIEINVRAVVELTKFAIPHLEMTKGNIVNLSSITGLIPFAMACSYCMTKSAINMYTKCAALELAPKGIRVNSLHPGIIKTPIYEKLGLTDSNLKTFLDNQEERYPIGRLGDVDDTTNAILFLADERSSFITGVSLSVDGGRAIA